jgi:hypothetical protein
MSKEYKLQIEPLSIVELAILKEALNKLIEEYDFYLNDYGQEVINIKHILNNPEYVQQTTI